MVSTMAAMLSQCRVREVEGARQGPINDVSWPWEIGVGGLSRQDKTARRRRVDQQQNVAALTEEARPYVGHSHRIPPKFSQGSDLPGSGVARRG